MFKCPLGDCVSKENSVYIGLTSTTLSRRLTMHTHTHTHKHTHTHIYIYMTAIYVSHYLSWFISGIPNAVYFGEGSISVIELLYYMIINEYVLVFIFIQLHEFLSAFDIYK